MNSGRNSKLSLFLMELIVAIMFFSLSAAVCVRLFASAHFLAEKTESLSNAVMWAQNVSEAFTGNGGRLSDIALLYPDAYVISNSDDSENGSKNEDGQIILFLDKDWNLIDTTLSEAAYEVYLDISVKPAREVYSDVTDYDVTYEGNAIVGDIKVLNVEGLTENYSQVADDESRLVHKNTVDVYIGKDAG